MSEAPAGVLGSLRRAAGTTLTLLQARLELLVIEVQEERQRLLTLLLWGGLAVLSLFVGVVFLAVFLTILWWDSHRLLVLGLATAIFGLFGLGACLRFRKLAQSPHTLFSASLAELREDRATLRGDAP